MSGAPKQIQSASSDGFVRYEGLAKAYFRSITGGSGSLCGGNVDFFIYGGAKPVYRLDENSCQAIVADNEDGKNTS